MLNISKILPARAKNSGRWGVNTTIVTDCLTHNFLLSFLCFSVNRFVAESEGQKLSKLLASKRLVIDPRQLDDPLLDSCRTPGRHTCVQPLLDAGADPNCCDSDGRTPLYLLLERGAAKPPIMKILLKSGANPNKATYHAHQFTPFHLACKKGLQVLHSH